MPPGPPRWPIIGNTLQVPSSLSWITFTEWSKKYGPVFSLDLLGQPVVVLNSHRAAADLLDRRSQNYSDRPRMIMGDEILTGGMYMVFLKYGDRWRKMRRASHESFSLKGSEKFQPIQADATIKATLLIITQPASWEDHIKRMTISSILSSVYGWAPFSEQEIPMMKRMHAHSAKVSEVTAPGAYLVDFIPAMKYLPSWMAKWKREGSQWYEDETKMFEGFFASIAAELAAGNATDSFVAELIETEEKHGMTRKEGGWLAGILMYTAATLLTFILAMTLHSDVMRKAQEELDEVVGRDRVPSFKDKSRLPYVRAIVKETLRWRPVGPLAVPRKTTEDDWYEGYFIPKGTTVIPNVWDPEVYTNPEDFRPERFLDELGQVEISFPDTHQMGHVSYGFGRRICVGMHFANQALFIAVATILWALDIHPSVDESGNAIRPSCTDWIDTGVVVGPAPFPCSLTPRFPGARSILEANSLA
ncbi:cytochrome P450 [Cytidiella melzeri]|nr:cytochrome P450 [Cytidiella melzeri]